MNFFVDITGVLHKLYLRSCKTPKSRDHVLSMHKCEIALRQGYSIRHSPIDANRCRIARHHRSMIRHSLIGVNKCSTAQNHGSMVLYGTACIISAFAEWLVHLKSQEKTTHKWLQLSRDANNGTRTKTPSRGIGSSKMPNPRYASKSCAVKIS